MNHDDDKSKKTQESGVVIDTDVTNEAQSAPKQTSQEPPINKEESNESEQEMKSEKTWHNKNALKRGVAMLGYGFVAGFVRLGITLIAIFQFFSLLFAEKPNYPLVKFGQNLNTYLYQINQFLTVNSEMYPFPFADWPDADSKK